MADPMARKIVYWQQKKRLAHSGGVYINESRKHKQGLKMSLLEILNQALLDATKFTRAQIAANNYARLTGKRAPDNLSESWADK
jgi:hypothetical protein